MNNKIWSNKCNKYEMVKSNKQEKKTMKRQNESDRNFK